MTEVDVRGLSCPMPLVHTKEALKSNPALILVRADSGTAKANIVDLLRDLEYDIAVEESREEYRITGRRS